MMDVLFSQCVRIFLSQISSFNCLQCVVCREMNGNFWMWLVFCVDVVATSCFQLIIICSAFWLRPWKFTLHQNICWLFVFRVNITSCKEDLFSFCFWKPFIHVPVALLLVSTYVCRIPFLCSFNCSQLWNGEQVE